MPKTPSPDRFFTSLTDELRDRSAGALLGSLSPVSKPLRHHLRKLLASSPGADGALLSDVVVEAIFDWQAASADMDELARSGLLSDDLVRAMATPSADESLREYVFPADRHPFTHQYDSWRELSGSEPRSVLVSSGTGSGKTECFLVPILDQLARERTRLAGLGRPTRLRGVEALFLYPLNALINSQRDRLRAWCEPFGGDVRFCLYKGDTPETVRNSDRRASRREEVDDRTTLREDPPSILVTNSTMLEYMLIRAQDQPIIEQSQGMLKWIVLDEAHTYLGSHAAETALLLRRVMHAFGVEPGDVRFVATSATIGESDETKEALASFLADLAGTNADRVEVVTGRRTIPALPRNLLPRDEPLLAPADLRKLDSEARFAALASSSRMRLLRDTLLKERALRLSTLSDLRTGASSSDPAAYRETMELVDIATEATLDGQPFLRVRSHLFQRTHGGVWACLNPTCSGRANTPLDHPDWGFGKLFLERREKCDSCSSLVYDLLLCAECGQEYLSTDLTSEGGVHRYRPRLPRKDSEADDYSELIDVDDEPEEVDEIDSPRLWRLLANGRVDGLPRVRLNPADGTFDEDQGVICGEILGDTKKAPSCARCGESETRPGILFREARRGAPFFLRGIIPVLLDYTPPTATGGKRVPARGRRLLTFTDSRQGTARFALDAQLDSERNYVRGLVYHQLVGERRDREGAGSDDGQLHQEIEALRAVAGSNPALRSILEHRERELEIRQAPVVGRMEWRKMVSCLAGTDEIQRWMHEHWRNLPLANFAPNDVAHFCLLRELMRRPKRYNSLETLGLVALDYPALDSPRINPPAPWLERSLSKEEWRKFLKITVDFFVRGYSAVEVDERFLRWMGAPIRPKFLLGPDDQIESKVKQVIWPTVNRYNRKNRLIQLLAKALGEEPSDPDGAAHINTCLSSPW